MEVYGSSRSAVSQSYPGQSITSPESRRRLTVMCRGTCDQADRSIGTTGAASHKLCGFARFSAALLACGSLCDENRLQLMRGAKDR